MRRPHTWEGCIALLVGGFAIGCRVQVETVSDTETALARHRQEFSQASLDSFAKPSEAQLRAWLTPLQFEVTQEAATETPFANEFWDHHDAGLYVDVVSGEPLFSSRDKYNSGTGWPSFTKPLVAGNVYTRVDTFLGFERTEVRSQHADSHLGHLFPDGPSPTGLRYCINSAALRFIPRADLKRAGYGDYLSLFPSQ